jgi:FAD/FMN-containing dehydrogenase
MNADPALVARLPDELPDLDWIVDASRVARLSQDFSWFSPVLKRQLSGKLAEVAVRPRTEDEVRRLVGACARDRIPMTLRGSGTGNYGQSIPLHGGVLLDLSGLNGFGWVRGGVGRAQAGMRLHDFDKQARPQGWELRAVPSTFRTATLGGLFGGGFGGCGSITYGPVAAPGNVLGAKVMTVEPEPRIVELRDADAMVLHHTYGTTGIVLELEMALGPALPWLESIATFDSFDAALDFADALARAPGIVKKEVCFMSAAVTRYMTGLADFLPAGRAAVILAVAEPAESAMLGLVAAHGGTISYRKTAAEVQASGRTILEFTWNHTTLHALKIDKTLTYIQSAFDPVRKLEQVRALERALGEEVLMHLEFLRNRDGAQTCSGLQLVRYTSDARLDEIMRIYREHGVFINNPHVFIVEDGKQGQLTPGVVASKERFDPMGLLNPGKLRAWSARETDRHETAGSAAVS